MRRVAGDGLGLVLALLSGLGEGSKKDGAVGSVGSSHPRYASTSNKTGVGGVTAKTGFGVIEEEVEEDDDANGKPPRRFEPSICPEGLFDDVTRARRGSMSDCPFPFSFVGVQ